MKIAVADIPVTMGGAALFNVQNAMGALCLAMAMGVPEDAVVSGLTIFDSTPGPQSGTL